MSLHSQDEVTYSISGHRVTVVACWDGEWWSDKDRFYDLFDETGRHLNEGDPWYDRPKVSEDLLDRWDSLETWEKSEIKLTGGQGVPTFEEVKSAMDKWKPWEG